MSTHGSFNSKNPTIKRILKEATELSKAPTSDYAASPTETNLFEWHFTLKGPPAPSPYEGGIYHGRIVLPPSYPLRPPSFRFLTPSGRFEPNREICLSISGHHEESWQPAWGIRTALVAIRSFMDSEAKGQLGGVDTSREVRVRLAKESRTWRCQGCAKTNQDIVKEREELVGQEEKLEEEIPEELKLGYKDELVKQEDESSTNQATNVPIAEPVAPVQVASPVTRPTPTTTVVPLVPQSVQPNLIRPAARQIAQPPSSWLDVAIGSIAGILAVMVLRKIGIYLA